MAVLAPQGSSAGKEFTPVVYGEPPPKLPPGHKQAAGFVI